MGKRVLTWLNFVNIQGYSVLLDYPRVWLTCVRLHVYPFLVTCIHQGFYARSVDLSSFSCSFNSNRFSVGLPFFRESHLSTSCIIIFCLLTSIMILTRVGRKRSSNFLVLHTTSLGTKFQSSSITFICTVASVTIRMQNLTLLSSRGRLPSVACIYHSTSYFLAKQSIF